MAQVMPPAAFNAPFTGRDVEDPDYQHQSQEHNGKSTTNTSYGTSLAVGGRGYVQPPLFPNQVHTPAATRFRNMLINTDKLIVCPGVYDGLSARVAHEVGFEALYMVSLPFHASSVVQKERS